MNIQGVPMLFPDGIKHHIADLKGHSDRGEIVRMVSVCQLEDGSIVFNRVARDVEDDSLLAYIGMLDFAKMGFFSQGTTDISDESPNPSEDIGDVGWIDEEGASE